MRGAAVVLALAWFAGGCAQLPRPPATAGMDETVRCERLYADVDHAVAQAGVADGGAARIHGFSYLRVNRLLASFAAETGSADRFAAWVEGMQALDRDARQIELANLPAPERARLQAGVSGNGVDAALQRCADLLTARDLATEQRRDALRAQARVPDDYDTWKRTVGLYWITRIPFASGVRSYQAQVEAVFQRPVQELSVRGNLVTYAPVARCCRLAGRGRGDPRRLAPQCARDSGTGRGGRRATVRGFCSRLGRGRARRQ